MTSGPERTSTSAPEQREYVLRRAPRLSAVVLLAALGGLVAALIGTAVVHSGAEPLTDPYSGAPLGFASTYGYMAVAFALVSILLGLLVWLMLDRRSRRRERTVTLERVDAGEGTPDGRTTEP